MASENFLIATRQPRPIFVHLMYRLRRPCRRSQICTSRRDPHRRPGSTILCSRRDSGHTDLRGDKPTQRQRRPPPYAIKGRAKNEQTSILHKDGSLRYPLIAPYASNQSPMKHEGTKRDKRRTSFEPAEFHDSRHLASALTEARRVTHRAAFRVLVVY